MKIKTNSERLDDMANFVRAIQEYQKPLTFSEKVGTTLMLLAYIWFIEE